MPCERTLVYSMAAIALAHLQLRARLEGQEKNFEGAIHDPSHVFRREWQPFTVISSVFPHFQYLAVDRALMGLVDGLRPPCTDSLASHFFAVSPLIIFSAS